MNKELLNNKIQHGLNGIDL